MSEMEIGSKVRYNGDVLEEQVRCGANDDPRTYLTQGAIYTVAEVEAHDWHTKVYLEEFPDLEFNSVHFETVEPQPKE